MTALLRRRPPLESGPLLRLLLLLPLLLLLRSDLRDHVFLLISDDLGVGPVRWVQLDIGDLLGRRGAGHRIHQEFDDDDGRDKQSKRRANSLLAAAVAHEREKVAECRAWTKGPGKPGHDTEIGLA